jgi:hypothetical protein
MQELKQQLKQGITCLLMHDVEQILEERDVAKKPCVQTGDTKVGQFCLSFNHDV